MLRGSGTDFGLGGQKIFYRGQKKFFLHKFFPPRGLSLKYRVGSCPPVSAAPEDMSKMLCPCLHTSNDFVEWNCTLKLTIRSQSKELGRSSSRSIYLLKHIGHLRYERRSHGLTTGNGKAQDRPTKLFEPRCCFKTHQLESILKSIVVIRGKWKFEEEGDDDAKEQVQNILKPALSVGIGDRWLRRRHLNKKLYGLMGLPQNKN